MVVRNGAAVVGLVLIAAGCWMVSVPAALLSVGGLLLAGALYGWANDRRAR